MEKKINSFFNIIKSFDYFGVYYTFHYNHEEKFRSFVGGLIFLVYLLLSLLFILLNFDGFISRKNISLIYYDRRIATPYFLNFKNYSNNLAFGLNCDNEYGTNNLDKYLDLNLSFVEQVRTNNQIIRNRSVINYHKCKEEDFDESFTEFFRQNRLNSLNCMNDTSKSISGFYTDTYFNYYEFTVLTKDNSSELYKNLSDILLNYECRFEMYYGDTTVNVYDFKNPVKTYLNQRYNILLPDSLLKYNYFFKQISFKSYDNLLIDKYNFNNYMGFSRTEEYRQLKSLDRFNKSYINFNIMAKIFLRSDNIDRIVQRNYEKFTQFMAQLSTVLSICFLIFYTLIGKLNNYFSNFVIMKALFNYDLKKKEKLLLNFTEKKNKNYISLIQTIFNESDQNILFISQGNKFENLSQNIKLKSLNEKKDKDLNDFIFRKKNYKDGYKSFQLNVIELFFKIILFCFPYKNLKRKNRIYKKSFIKISNYIDITNYIQNIRNLQILFYLTLDKKKKLIINDLRNPIITLNKDYDFCELISNKYNLNINNNNNNFSNILIQYFNDLKKNKNLNSQDKKMLKFISNQIQK